MKYKAGEIEPKWQKRWQEAGIYKTEEKSAKPKKYILDMFPYPSGATMHVGHLEGYVGTDIISRYERMKGRAVLHPMGWDAFGLPAENYAIKTGIHPDKSTHENIEVFKRQLNITGLSYDWSREIDTSSPEYYKWTQWLFILLFKHGLTYKKKADVNWCPSCQTVLANEQVVDGKCDRCSSEVIKKKLDQWFLKITAYADRLISGLDKIDWLEEVKIQQKNWIGKSEGINIKYQVLGIKYQVECFTTRPDTNFGATFIVLGPEHPVIDKVVKPEFKEAVEKYVKAALSKSELDRIAEGRKKTGVFTGSYAVNQLNNQKLPIWVSDFVLGHVGTGAVVGVPGHDRRDFEFAREFNLPIVRVVVGEDGDKSSITNISQVQEKEGTMINSGFLDGIDIHAATTKVMDYLEEKGWGRRVITYHLRDWLISRQRYWGAPIPMIYCQKCADKALFYSSTKPEGRVEKFSTSSNDKNIEMAGWFSLPEEELPVFLPKDVDFRPTGESPIARSKSFQKGVKCPNCGGAAKREVDTMDTYVDSSWYFIRFVDSKNAKEFASSQSIKDWLPVDSYVGGGHVVQHLLFARFFWKVLFDAGLIDKSLGDEPFLKLRAPGWILGPDSRKMSKRWNNVVTPDDVIPKYGADAMRMYEMFLGPFEVMKPWSLTGVEGIARFIKRIWVLFEETIDIKEVEFDIEVKRLMHRLVKKVGEDIENMSFNTAISTMMETYNGLTEMKKRGVAIDWKEAWEKFLLVLAPFAPHMAEELWQRVHSRVHSNEIIVHSKKEGEKSMNYELPAKRTQNWSVHLQPWPSYDSKLVKSQKATLVVQVNGKVRDRLLIEAGITQEEAEKLALNSQKVQKFLGNKKPQKVVYVQDRLINLVTGTKGTTSTKSTKGMGGR